MALVLFLVAPPFSGPFVVAFPKIQIRLYRAWLMVDTTPTTKMTTMTLSIVLGPPSPWRQNKPWNHDGGYCPYECGSSAVSDGRGWVRGRPQPKIAFTDIKPHATTRFEETPCPWQWRMMTNASGDYPRWKYGQIPITDCHGFYENNHKWKEAPKPTYISRNNQPLGRRGEDHCTYFREQRNGTASSGRNPEGARGTNGTQKHT